MGAFTAAQSQCTRGRAAGGPTTRESPVGHELPPEGGRLQLTSEATRRVRLPDGSPPGDNARRDDVGRPGEAASQAGETSLSGTVAVDVSTRKEASPKGWTALRHGIPWLPRRDVSVRRRRATRPAEAVRAWRVTRRTKTTATMRNAARSSGRRRQEERSGDSIGASPATVLQSARCVPAQASPFLHRPAFAIDAASGAAIWMAESRAERAQRGRVPLPRSARFAASPLNVASSLSMNKRCSAVKVWGISTRNNATSSARIPPGPGKPISTKRRLSPVCEPGARSRAQGPRPSAHSPPRPGPPSPHRC